MKNKQIYRTPAFSILMPLLSVASAFAGVTVSSPSSGATVASPFALAATASPCSSQTVSAMGYSFDGSSTTTIVNGTSISTLATAAAGSHVLHVKSWGTGGASCTADVSITVQAAAGTPTTNVTVSSPAVGASLLSPFALAAAGTLCSSQAIAAMGYSIDSGSTTIVNAKSVSAKISASTGAHTVHVKSWGVSGAACDTDIALTVLPPPVVSVPPVIPANATAAKLVQNLTKWNASFDTATGPGTASSSGTTALVPLPSVTGSARQFTMNYTNYGGERFNVTVGNNAAASNFLYDGWVYVASPNTDVANIEIDMNQTMANGETVIFGMQCDGWSKTWDYTTNSGTTTAPIDTWLHSNQTCDPQTWTTNTWHHVQLSYSRDNSGNITYNSVWLDSVQQEINEKVPSAFSLGWAVGGLVTNFQIDGMTSTAGTATAYLDNVTVYFW